VLRRKKTPYPIYHLYRYSLYKASTGSLSPERVIFGICVTIDPEKGGK